MRVKPSGPSQQSSGNELPLLRFKMFERRTDAEIETLLDAAHAACRRRVSRARGRPLPARLGISSRPDDRSRYRSRHRAPTRSCWSRSAPAPDARTRSCGSTRCRAGNARRAPPSQPVISQLTHRPVNWGTSPQRNEIAASPGVVASRRHATALLAPGLSVYRQCAMTSFS